MVLECPFLSNAKEGCVAIAVYAERDTLSSFFFSAAAASSSLS